MTIPKEDFYSTTEIANICHVHRNTIILAIRKGELKASATPGGHNRIHHDEFVRFAKEKGLPVLGFPGQEEGPPLERPVTPPPPARGADARRKVLVVDDDKMVHKQVEKALDSKLYEVHSAFNGYEAGFKTSVIRPDLILLDIMLGDLDGGEVYSMLRENEFTRDVKILVITSMADDERIRRSFPEEVSILKKPLRGKDIAERVGQILGVARAGVASG